MNSTIPAMDGIVSMTIAWYLHAISIHLDENQFSLPW